MYYDIAVKNIRSELKNYIINNNIKSLVLGVSGGIDSLLCALLAKPVCDELEIPLIGASITIESNKDDEIKRAKDTGKTFCTIFYDKKLTSLYKEMAENFNPYPVPHDHLSEQDIIDWKIRNGNIKARMRMIYLYNLASKNKGLVLSTDNYTEYLLGFSTIMGDWGDYGMIQNIWKTEVYEITEWIKNNEYYFNHNYEKIIEDTINATATDGLGITDSDLEQIMPEWNGNSRQGYKEVDKILARYTKSGFGDSTDPVIQRHIKSNFKRNWPINIPLEKITKNV